MQRFTSSGPLSDPPTAGRAPARRAALLNARRTSEWARLVGEDVPVALSIRKTRRSADVKTDFEPRYPILQCNPDRGFSLRRPPMAEARITTFCPFCDVFVQFWPPGLTLQELDRDCSRSMTSQRPYVGSQEQVFPVSCRNYQDPFPHTFELGDCLEAIIACEAPASLSGLYLGLLDRSCLQDLDRSRFEFAVDPKLLADLPAHCCADRWSLWNSRFFSCPECDHLIGRRRALAGRFRQHFPCIEGFAFKSSPCRKVCIAESQILEV